jgi:hypothetical protein
MRPRTLGAVPGGGSRVDSESSAWLLVGDGPRIFVSNITHVETQAGGQSIYIANCHSDDRSDEKGRQISFSTRSLGGLPHFPLSAILNPSFLGRRNKFSVFEFCISACPEEPKGF